MMRAARKLTDQEWRQHVERTHAQWGAPLPGCQCRSCTSAAQERTQELLDAGYSQGEAEDIQDHDEGQHEEESVPGCPRCDALYDPEPLAPFDEQDAKVRRAVQAIAPAGKAIAQAQAHDHDEGAHDEESLPGCPRCEALYDAEDALMRQEERRASDLDDGLIWDDDR